MVFGRNFCEKMSNLARPEPHFGKVKGDTHMTLVDGSLESRQWLCIRLNWTFFRCLLRFRGWG